MFSGFINEDPREYLVTFKRRCISLNHLTEDRWLMILPIFLDDSAKVWYERQTDAVRQNWLRLTSAMIEYFGKGEEPMNVHLMVAKLTQEEGEMAHRYVDRAAMLLDCLVAPHADDEGFVAGMTQLVLGRMVVGAEDQFRLKLKWESPVTIEQARVIAAKFDRMSNDRVFIPSLMCVPKVKVNHGGSTSTYPFPSQPPPHPRPHITPDPIDVPSRSVDEKVVDDPCIDLVDIVETSSTVTGGSNDEEIECERCDGATSPMSYNYEDFLLLDQDSDVSSGALSPSLNDVDEEKFEGMDRLLFEDDIDELEVLVAEYDGELSSPSSPMNFMEPIENIQEDNLPTVLEVFQEDAFRDIDE